MKKVFIHSIFLTLIIFLLNNFLDTMLQFPETHWEKAFHNHLVGIPFRLRPFTNLALGFLTKTCAFSIGNAFKIHQYLLLYIFFISFGLLFQKLQFTKQQVLRGLYITAFSFPILCVHFIPNYTWDNVWMYVGLIWFVYFLIDKKLFVASLFLLFASISHESALFASFGFFFFRDKSKSHLNWILPTAFVIICYGIFRVITFPNVMSGRFAHIYANFADANAIRQTIFSIFVSFGWIWAILVFVRRKIKKIQDVPEIMHSFLYSAIFTSCVTVPIVLFVGLARETRLFYAPFIFLIPLAVYFSNSFFCNSIYLRKKIGIIKFGSIVVILFAIATLLTVYAFPSFAFLPIIDFHRVYFSLNLTIILVSFLKLRKS